MRPCPLSNMPRPYPGHTLAIVFAGGYGHVFSFIFISLIQTGHSGHSFPRMYVCMRAGAHTCGQACRRAHTYTGKTMATMATMASLCILLKIKKKK